MDLVVMTTLIVTFVLVVGLALVVLLSVAAPPMRRRGSRTIHRLDDWVGRVLPVVARHRERARRSVEQAVEARRRATEDREAAQQH